MELCSCGFCGPNWSRMGWRCHHTGVAHMVSGRGVELYHGARSDLAERLGVPPGFLCRRADTIIVAKTPCDGSNGGNVGLLPVEYYTDTILKLFTLGLQIGNDNSVILDGDIVFDLESRNVEHIDYFSGYHHIFFKSGWTTCAPICLTMRSEYLFAHNLVLLRAAPSTLGWRAAQSRRGGRCSRAMWHVCARWRARRAVKAEQEARRG